MQIVTLSVPDRETHIGITRLSHSIASYKEIRLVMQSQRTGKWRWQSNS
jgi:hypothetical protein